MDAPQGSLAVTSSGRLFTGFCGVATSNRDEGCFRHGRMLYATLQAEGSWVGCFPRHYL